jgi:hypothetical protein
MVMMPPRNKTPEQVVIEETVTTVVQARDRLITALDELRQTESTLMGRFRLLKEAGRWVEHSGPTMVRVDESHIMSDELEEMRSVLIGMARAYINEALPGDEDDGFSGEAHNRMHEIFKLERWLRPFGVELRENLMPEYIE